ADITDPISGLGLADPDVQRLPGRVHQPLGLWRYLADAERQAGVRPETAVDQAGVEAEQVTLAQLAIGRNAVDHLVVHGGADGVLVALVADEPGNAATPPDKAIGLPVQLEQGDAGSGDGLQPGQRLGKNGARLPHQVDLGLGLLCGQPEAASFGSAAKRWAMEARAA